ncbi:MAG: [FeFe] hydrogenase H-cluster radical SAM maturase HydG [Candidatus Omnitrophica bacterium]|nr:[FeFe] hydrogenase H-cluster radical SAM maturase HydG [Candidatus Omnitrophota bacterium]
MVTNTMESIRSWQKERVKEDEITRYLDHGRDFIDDNALETLLARAPGEPEPARVREILAKSLSVKDLSLEEVALLINVRDPDILEEMRETAFKVKLKIYDNRIVTFAPFYLGNYCVNRCTYCGFNSDNREARRRVLDEEAIKAEVVELAGKIGHKRLIAVYGEHPKNDVDYIVRSLETIYSVRVPTRHGHGSIRRVNVNAPPFPVADLKRIGEAGIGTYQVFQETYHRKTYARLHPADTIKGNYRWRLYCMHRSLEAGIDDVGIGALFGLYDWRFELLALVKHSQELEQRLGIGAHTISFPRLVPALNSVITPDWPHLVSDEDFRKIMLVIRLAVPYTGMIITAREKAAIRNEAVRLGITQMDASSRIAIGGYSDHVTGQAEDRQQFILGDTRSLDTLVRDLAAMGHITSFCTAGYRCGRTGKCIMDLLRSGAEGKFCKLNAVLTFQEWLDDFAGEETRRLAQPLIEREVADIRAKNPKALDIFLEYHARIKKGERDLYL